MLLSHWKHQILHFNSSAENLMQFFDTVSHMHGQIDIKADESATLSCPTRHFPSTPLYVRNRNASSLLLDLLELAQITKLILFFLPKDKLILSWQLNSKQFWSRRMNYKRECIGMAEAFNRQNVNRENLINWNSFHGKCWEFYCALWHKTSS